MSYRGFYDSQAYDLPAQSDGQYPQQQQVWEPRGLTPLTIKQILKAMPGDTGELTVAGKPLQQVRVVGQYAEESRRGSQAYFFLNDSSGQLHCSCTLDGNAAMARVFDQLQHCRSYVAVVGKVKPGNSMFVYHARLVTDYNQLIYHAIECVREDLSATAAVQPTQQPQQLPSHRVYPDRQPQQPTFQVPAAPRSFTQHALYSSFAAPHNPPPRSDTVPIPSAMGRPAPAGASYNANSLAHFAPTANAAVWPPPPRAANQLRSQIVDVLRKHASNEDGVSTQTIDAAVKGATIVDISNEINRMSDEAKDEYHYKLCN